MRSLFCLYLKTFFGIGFICSTERSKALELLAYEVEVDGADEAEVDGADETEVDGVDEAEVDGVDEAEVDGADKAKVDGENEAEVDVADESVVDGASESVVDGADAAISSAEASKTVSFSSISLFDTSAGRKSVSSKTSLLGGWFPALRKPLKAILQLAALP